MPDDIDDAQDRETAEREAALLRRRLLAQVPHGASRHDCQDCGDDIPEARRQLVPGCTRCTRCQQLRERCYAL